MLRHAYPTFLIGYPFQKDLEVFSYLGCCRGFHITVLSVLHHRQNLHRHMTGCWMSWPSWRETVVQCGLQLEAPSRFESWHMRIRQQNCVFALDFFVSSFVIFLLSWPGLCLRLPDCVANGNAKHMCTIHDAWVAQRYNPSRPSSFLPLLNV
jgi:hypothetical protein